LSNCLFHNSHWAKIHVNIILLNIIHTDVLLTQFEEGIGGDYFVYIFQKFFQKFHIMQLSLEFDFLILA